MAVNYIWIIFFAFLINNGDIYARKERLVLVLATARDFLQLYLFLRSLNFKKWIT